MRNLLNLGKALNKAEQKEVFGGGFGTPGGGGDICDVPTNRPSSCYCDFDSQCASGVCVEHPLPPPPGENHRSFGNCQ